MAREREALRGLIGPHQSHTPLPELIGRVNRHLRGWSNYSAATLQSHSQSSGAATGPRHRRRRKIPQLHPSSHVVSLLYAHLTHALGLNDVCDALRLHSGPLSAIRGATPPK